MLYGDYGSRPRCQFANTFQRIAEQTIFAKITDRTTPDMYQAAQQSLVELSQQLEKQSQADMFHFSTLGGIHCCVNDAYTEAAFRLKNLAIMHQQALPAQAPVPKRQLISREGIVRDVEDKIPASTEDTELGKNARLPEIRRFG